MCVKKKRHMDIETTGSRLGFRTFQRFYELTTRPKTPKTQQEFIDSPYYTEFAKFGNHLANLKPIYTEKYIEFVILGGVKLKDWTKDEIYDLFVVDVIKKEPPTSATERTITEIVEWSTKNNTAFDKFFSDVSPNEGAYLIKTGRLSPWVLYLCASGEDLMKRFSADHSKMIGDVIDPGYWMQRFKKSAEDVEYIKTLLEQAGL